MDLLESLLDLLPLPLRVLHQNIENRFSINQYAVASYGSVRHIHHSWNAI